MATRMPLGRVETWRARGGRAEALVLLVARLRARRGARVMALRILKRCLGKVGARRGWGDFGASEWWKGYAGCLRLYYGRRAKA